MKIATSRRMRGAGRGRDGKEREKGSERGGGRMGRKREKRNRE